MSIRNPSSIIKGIYLFFKFKFNKKNNSIRLIQIRERFGQLVSDMAYYAAEKELGFINGTVDYFYFRGEEGMENSFLKKIYSRQYSVLDLDTSRIISRLFKKNIRRGYEGVNHDFDKDLNGVLLKTEPKINFTDNEIEIGEKFFDQFQKDHKGIVCLSLKDKAHYSTIDSFNDYPMSDNEFGDIYDYQESINELTKNGYFVIRVGADVTGKLDINNDLYFDYATSGQRNDFLDIYIASKCKFIFSNQSGYDMLGIAFRKPVVTTNNRCFQYQINNYPFTLFLPKRYYDTNEKRYLTFREMFDLETKIFNHGGHYADNINTMNNLGVFIEKDNPDAILSYTKEVIDYFNGSLTLTDSDNNLQKKLWKLYLEADFNIKYNYNDPSEIYLKASPLFLRKNKWMLD